MFNPDSELEEYILSHIDEEPPALHELYRYTNMHHLYPRMCSGHYQGRLLKMLTAMINPGKVLELGTFTGYSTLSIAEGLTKSATIDTVEIDDEKEEELRLRFSDSPYSRQINLYIGDALKIIEELDGPWDMVYIDANKRQYSDYLEAVVKKVPVGRFILVDNTLWDMKVVTNELLHDSQTKAIATFNDALVNDKRFEKVILPIRDGLTLIRRIR